MQPGSRDNRVSGLTMPPPSAADATHSSSRHPETSSISLSTATTVPPASEGHYHHTHPVLKQCVAGGAHAHPSVYTRSLQPETLFSKTHTVRRTSVWRSPPTASRVTTRPHSRLSTQHRARIRHPVAPVSCSALSPSGPIRPSPPAPVTRTRIATHTHRSTVIATAHHSATCGATNGVEIRHAAGGPSQSPRAHAHSTAAHGTAAHAMHTIDSRSLLCLRRAPRIVTQVASRAATDHDTRLPTVSSPRTPPRHPPSANPHTSFRVEYFSVTLLAQHPRARRALWSRSAGVTPSLSTPPLRESSPRVSSVHTPFSPRTRSVH